MAKFCGKCGSQLDKKGRCPQCEKSFRKRRIENLGSVKEKKLIGRIFKLLLALVLLALLLLVGAGLLTYFDFISIPVLQKNMERLGLTQTQKETFENGDYFSRPEESDVQFDEDSNVLYIREKLIVYTFDALSDREKSALAKTVNGKVVGSFTGAVDAFQISIEGAELKELEAAADILMQDERVLFAGYDYPIFPEETTIEYEPWSDQPDAPDADRGNEVTPGGNDWWAEAIHAYRAWEIVDDSFSPVRVGVIDSGFDDDHEELKGAIQYLSGFDQHDAGDHGTHVAGLIGARNNGVGIRGVADQAELYCVDWSPSGSPSLLTTGDVLEATKQLIENGVHVINNSWGSNLLSKDEYVYSVYWDEKGLFHELTDNSIRLKNNKSNQGYDSEYFFKGNDISNVKFYINQDEVALEKFNKSVQSGNLIRLTLDHDEVTGIYFIKSDYLYSREFIAEFIVGGYDAYLEYASKRELRTALESMIMIMGMMRDGNDQFLIVQSAGNGYNNSGPGTEAKHTCWYDAINEEAYQVLSEQTREKLEKSYGITLDSIRERVLVVGAVENQKNSDQEYVMTSFSNFGSNVDLCAPGSDVYSTLTRNGYGNMSGTSMSGPIAAGSAALLWSANPDLSPGEVKRLLTNSAITKAAGVGDGSEYHSPMLDVGMAVSRTVAQRDGYPDGSAYYDGHYYQCLEIDGITTWQDAERYCESQGGHLATITSAEENQFLHDYLLSLNRTAAYFGYSDADSEGHWRWINDEQTGYANWFDGEPNGDNDGEDYAMFYHARQTDQWNDGDFGVLSEGGRAFICEWEALNRSQAETEAPVLPPEETQTPVQTETPTPPVSEERDVVLVLDTSGSMSGDPMSETKKAAIKFVQTVLPQNAGVGIVTFNRSASVVSGFSRDEWALTDAINDIYDSGATNTEAGLSTAYDMLRQSNAGKRIIVLMSDGMPNNGRGGQDLIDYANSIKSDDVYVYTLGFFSELSEGEKISAQSLMEGIASDGCHYEVANADDLVFFFNDIADQINGQKYIYVRIACPVDVSVSYNGQRLNSAEDALSLRTDFGTLTFEQNEVNEENPDQDDRVKVLRLKEGVDYDVQIEGTGRGVMEYTIGFMDEDGKYSDFRTFRNVRITEQTMIDTVATVSEESILNVDDDGDGKYDVRYSAEANGYGKEIKTSKLPYIVIGADAMFAIIIILIILVRNHKNNKGKVSY